MLWFDSRTLYYPADVWGYDNTASIEVNTIFNTTPIPLQTRVNIFEEIFIVFLGLGALVGVVVIAYTLYNAYKYRDDGTMADGGDVPTLGELPTGGKGGKKLFLSFGLSAIIVVSLIMWTYGMLLYVEDGPDDGIENIEYEIEINGQGFAWFFDYAEIDGVEYDEDERISQPSEMVMPADEPVAINVTAGDVWHTFGVPEQRVKADAIPGEHDVTWFEVSEDDLGDDGTAQFEIECFELCGPQHGDMTATLTVMEQDQFDQWVEDSLPEDEDDDEDDEDEDDDEDGSDEDETNDGGED